MEASVKEISEFDLKSSSRLAPLVKNSKTRASIGLVILALSAFLAATIHDSGRVLIVVLLTGLAWIPATLLTEKYTHKYPQRYFTYLLASHFKAMIIMACVLWILDGLIEPRDASQYVLWTAFILFVLLDLGFSAPCHTDSASRLFVAEDPTRIDQESTLGADIPPIDKQTIVAQLRPRLSKLLVEFIESSLPDTHGATQGVMILEDATATQDQSNSAPVGLLLSCVRMNDVRRLNRHLLSHAEHVAMGGYFVSSYVPLDHVAKRLSDRYTGWLYRLVFIRNFLWYRAFPKIPWLNTFYFWWTKGQDRVFSKTEIWGRLAYCGMHVVAESQGDDEVYIVAQRVEMPVQNRKPSYYPIVALEKVGLDGNIMRMHKVRSMYAFSEFLQKRIFEDHGLSPTGKFKNDPRLTEYGPFIRKYWIDEIPQIYDWIRGDIKLVGIRATSRHYLSLYPPHFKHLYLQTKPGLIPPIFDESTNGFDQIVDIELTYLRAYWRRPIRTDIKYLIETFVDIVFKGVRSR